MILGEAPGADEDSSGTPFIGRSGQLLRDTLESMGIKDTDCYITNAVKCRPPKNRTPKPDELEACSPWLRMELDAVRPERIICVGAAAARSLFGAGAKHRYAVVKGLGKKGQELFREPTLEELRRRDDLVLDQFSSFRVPVQVAYHPAAALRSPRMRSFFVRDVEKLAESMGLRQEADQKVDYRITQAFSEDWPLVGDKVIAIDTEYEEDGSLVCWSFSVREGTGRVVIPKDDILSSAFLSDLIRTASTIVMHNAKADVPAICNYMGLPLEYWPWEKTEDTIVLAYNLGKRPLALKALAENTLGLKVIRLNEIMQEGDKIADIPRERLVKYSAQDADITLRLYWKLLEELKTLCPTTASASV